MYELKLKFFDTIMDRVRREEAKYRQYAIYPPEHPPSKGGLFGLAPLDPPKPGGFLVGNALVSKPPPSPWVHDELVSDIKENLIVVDHLAGMLELSGSVDRVKLFRGVIAFMPTYEACHQEWRALRQHLDEELNQRIVLYVGRVNGAHLALMESDWGPALVGFPSTRAEVERGLKCFAYEQFTACVFHMMRVAEHGLRAVAKERRITLPKNRPIDEAEWGMLTTRLRTEGDKVANWPARRKERKAALGYYSTVHADVLFFKDSYRNVVSHSLTPFGEEEADRVVTRVCDFMKAVSSRTDESGKRIAWK